MAKGGHDRDRSLRSVARSGKRSVIRQRSAWDQARGITSRARTGWIGELGLTLTVCVPAVGLSGIVESACGGRAGMRCGTTVVAS